MSQGIKDRIFGSDVPNIVKKKIEARQLLAYEVKGPNESISHIDPTDNKEKSLSHYQDSRTAMYTYGELNNMNFGGIADLSSRTPAVRLWTAVNIKQDMTLRPNSDEGPLTKEEAELHIKEFESETKNGEI